ncbi:ubiquitin-conjugating enzyme family protein [Entamoeba histolytica HM-1:IMSS-B]|uniref:Ubiquitin-conjugating enzyme family protein n=8 Tax=Entamoeba TaxID=5758 RepID=C4M6M3_ENTH1|nr:ubiquitin-conjugating enzyme family protein [Entamoeba nuttalli P19]XP_654531.1 ubiquitin-conjugating enzyme family protein [Entamoeba histolytica HM-1:IMSS]EMD47346.1 ubiquitinconjugating enzyme family protein [Entamoeba histolytica KU27]EMH76823.1 ubiquitin-conjugating enzyme family protein [Entamoeba histolytica HM-1:IMSS-B]EMS10972.1 ubiquitin-conjugating enzyme family protein [Entamoeba histolytica HM-3:IMSS]ENY61220.1 ubiquitin-conjugating enzyme family protein, putative [Entamoeba hi|eukprot:XP_008857383.1 ubiquitin-conjugating enzyme family protein [Entamoeba nuttalli P19]
MSGLAIQRLTEERRLWRREHPPGFIARPRTTKEGTPDLLTWDCGIPGAKGTEWEGGIYPLTMEFTEEYPTRPPKCRFPKGFYHPNIYPSGTVCLSILNEEQDWRPSISVKQILLGIQELLNTPNTLSPAQPDAFKDITNNKELYHSKVQKQRIQYDQEKFTL